jgi:hypothetical protein
MVCCHNSVHTQIIEILAQILPVQIRHGKNWALLDKCLGATLEQKMNFFKELFDIDPESTNKFYM